MLRQLVHVFWGRAGIVACRMVAAMVLAHHLLPADFGRLAFVMTTFDIFTSVTSVGIMVAGPVMVAEAGDMGRRFVVPILVQATICAIGSALLLAAIRMLFAERLFDGITALSLDLLLVSLLPGQLIWAQLGYLNGREKFAQVSLLSVLHWGGFLLAVILVVVAGSVDLSSAILCFLIPTWIAAMVGLGIVIADGQLAYSHEHLRGLFDLGWRSQLTQVLNLFQMRLDMILLRILAPAEQLGYYSVATNLSEWMLYLPRSLRQVAMPRSARGSELPARVYGWLFGILVAVALVVALGAPWLVSSFFGSGYEAAIPVVRAILPGTVLLGLGTLASGILFGRRDTTFLAMTGALVVLAFMLADFWVIPTWGALGCAVVSTVLYSLYSVILLRRLFDGQPGQLRACFLPRVRWRHPDA